MRNRIAWVMLCCCLLATAPSALAQTVQGVVTGSIFDTTGAVVPGATVTLINEGTNVAQTVTSGAAGAYRFPLVPPGTYTVSAKAANFRETVQKGIFVGPSQTVSLNVTLQVGPATQSVEVTSAAPLVQTQTSDLTHSVNSTAITSIPLVSRNVYDLTFAAPQVVQGMDFMPAAGGEREAGTSYLLNGSDNNDNFSEGSVNITPPLESVQELNLITNDMSAQYGRGGGVVVSAVQKSGTNSFHGALYEFNRNRSLNAANFFDNRNGNLKAAYVRNQFGGEVDGPIIKDKTFFSFAYDQVTLHTGSNQATSVPTASQLAAISAGAGPLARYYLGKYTIIPSSVPCPNEDPSAIGFYGCQFFFDPVHVPTRTYYGRVDQNFSGKDRLSFTANVYRLTYMDKYGGGYPFINHPIDYTDGEHYHNLTLVETHTFGPTIVNEFTVAHNRHYSNAVEGGAKNLDPQLAIDGDSYASCGQASGECLQFGPYEGGIVLGFTQDRWQLADNATFIKGRHSVRVGAGWQHGILYRNWDLGLPGYYEFGNDVGPTPAAAGVLNPDGTISNLDDETVSNFQNDFPYFEETSIDPHTGQKANAYRHYSMNDGFIFGQDDWKITPHFTLNLGLRWDQYGAPTEQHGIIAQFTNLNCLTPGTTVPYITCIHNAKTGPVSSMWNTRHKDFGPRFGFAWDVFGNGRTAVRGGYTISYDRIFDNVWSNGAWNPPFYGLVDWAADGGDVIFYSNPPSVPAYVPDSLPGPAGRVSIRTMENNLKDSSAQNFYLGVERQLFANMLVRVNYQGSLGRHLPQLMNLNRYDGMCNTPKLSCPRPNSLYTGFNYRANNVTSNYNALVAEVQKRFSHGLQFQFGYTYSHLLDYGSDLFTGSTTQGAYSQPYYFVSNAHKNIEYATGAFDHRHALKLTYSYELPIMRNQEGILGKVVGGWQLTGFYQFYTGHPIEVYNHRTRFRARDASGKFIFNPDGSGINIGGDYNLDFTRNDHPVYVGTGNPYSGANPADGIFTDNNPIGCGQAGLPANVGNVLPGTKHSCDDAFGVTTPNTLFINPPGTGVRFGTLGRNVFRGPRYGEFDAGLYKNFKITERWKLQFRAEGINLPNHPNFDGIITDLNSSVFGKAQYQANNSRIIQLGLRLLF